MTRRLTALQRHSPHMFHFLGGYFGESDYETHETEQAIVHEFASSEPEAAAIAAEQLRAWVASKPHPALIEELTLLSFESTEGGASGWLRSVSELLTEYT